MSKKQNTTLALDLGSRTGFALGNDQDIGRVIVSGTWEFKNSRHEGGGSRYLRFQQKLHEALATTSIGRIFYEEVRRHAGTDAAHVYGGLLGILTAFCEANKIPYEGVPVGTIKKFWTGKGNAPKDAMVAQAVERGFDVGDDNEADALAILHWAFANRAIRAAVKSAAVAAIAALGVCFVFDAAAGNFADWFSYADWML